MIEVWVSEYRVRSEMVASLMLDRGAKTYGPMRFNARFSTWERAEQERDWYEARGYHVNLFEGPSVELLRHQEL